jgi:hypothetical protein
MLELFHQPIWFYSNIWYDFFCNLTWIRRISYTIKSANQPSDKTGSSKEGVLTWVAVPQSKKEYSQALPLSSNTKRPHTRNFLTVERNNTHISKQPANSQNLSYQNNDPKKYPHL